MLCERIVVGQRDEIASDARLAARTGTGRFPPPTRRIMTMKMDGMAHDMLMPGMLNDEELEQLDAARGKEFDRLFLRAMIGTTKARSPWSTSSRSAGGSRQDEIVFRFASDVYADQTTEIERMTKCWGD